MAVPSGWVEVPQPPDVSYGDHVDFLFDSPVDPNSLLLVVASGCTGCVTVATPASLAPTGSANATSISATRATFTATGNARSLSSYWSGQGSTALAAGYRTDGLVVIGPQAGNVAFAQVALTLPTASHAEATAVLNTVSIAGA